MNDEDPLLGRARRLWEALAAAPVSFAPSGGVSVVVSPESGLCPPSWVGVVMLGNAAIVTAPTASAAVARALEAGMMPQWRARTVESRAVARALGFRELGMQLSVRLDEF
ncbi:hypothetical protein R6L23_04935 [Streptomyces sp. SR27]|uniref:hypothetical protein n=1 Tax=Streptomyces sp. SR27 TaxID=3076630 RepID=UPI00295BF517|nr:hypothetical protein [Streptomyces sp. SR27]MDV9187572.1 hypothetical protein [Streptomyces sp. SR27]